MKYMWKAVAAAVLLCSIFELGCGDTFRQIATPIFQPAGDPGTFDTVAVIQSAGATQNGVLQQINVSGDTNIAEKPIGSGTIMGALDADGSFIFTPNLTSNNVTATAASAFSEVTVSLPGRLNINDLTTGPTYVASTKSGFVYVTVAGATSACPDSGYVGVIDATNLTLAKTVCLKDTNSVVLSNPRFLVQSKDTFKLYVLDPTANKVAIIDTTSTSLNKIVDVGSQPSYATLSIDQRFLFVLNQGSNDISVLQVSDQTVLPATISTGGTGSSFMVTDSRLNRLYVANTTSGDITAFDLTTGTPVMIGAPVKVGPSPVGIAALRDGSRVYVANGGNGTVTELLASNLSTVRTITVNSTAGATTKSIVASNDTSRVYVASSDPTTMSNGTTIIRTSDDSIVKTIKSPAQTCATAPCPLMEPIYVFTKKL